MCLAPTGPPLNFVIDVTGTTLELSWDQPAPELRSGLIRFYTLVCSSGGQPAITFSLKNVTMFSLDDFTLDTEYTCSVSASTSGGTGPSTSATSTTASCTYIPRKSKMPHTCKISLQMWITYIYH